jgi:hypothetical protein
VVVAFGPRRIRSQRGALHTHSSAPAESVGYRLGRQHADGHVVALRPLPDYDALFGIDVTDSPPTPTWTAQTEQQGRE